MPENRKKIAFMIPSLNVGGMQRVMSELMNHFAGKSDLDCYLVIYGKGRSIFYQLHQNISIYEPPFDFNDRFRIFYTYKTILFLRSTIKEIQPNAVLSFGELWNSLVLMSLFGLKFPVYVSDRCRPDKSFGFLHDNLRRLLYPRAAGIIAQTEKAKELYRSQFKNNNIQVLGNPFRAFPNNPSSKREKVIVSVGRLITSKNFDRLIKIFGRINLPDWKLIIIGGDALKQKNSIFLMELIKKEGLGSRVILAGTQKNINDYLLKAGIFAFTSSSEGFPNVIGEAMNAGLPVVAYDCVAGPSEMIEDGKNGFLIPLFDDAMFEEKLRYLMENENSREQMGTQAMESIQKFSLENIGRQYSKFLLNEN